MQSSLFDRPPLLKPEQEAPAELRLHDSWKEQLANEFDQPYFRELKDFLLKEKAEGKLIYPPGSLIFNALNRTPFDKVKVVLLGQDPYHGKGQAHGLCFSVPAGVPAPPSLVNIFRELNRDLGIPISAHGCLEKWADDGVLLLNAVLTVRANEAASHAKAGWQAFTNRIISLLSDKRQNIVFFLWGRYAQEKAELIDPGRHLILKAAHPSPFSAASGFFGCRHFSAANKYLTEKGLTPVNWNLQ